LISTGIVVKLGEEAKKPVKKPVKRLFVKKFVKNAAVPKPGTLK